MNIQMLFISLRFTVHALEASAFHITLGYTLDTEPQLITENHACTYSSLRFPVAQCKSDVKLFFSFLSMYGLLFHSAHA